LLDQPEFSKLAYLGVGALGGRYCAQHRCDGVPEFDAFLEKLSKPVSGGCKSSSWDEEIKARHIYNTVIDQDITKSLKFSATKNLKKYLLTENK
jgi:hypothetical protein